MSPSKSPSNPSPSKSQITKILKIWESQNPNPKCELFYLTPFQLLVSVALSAQTTDKMVNRCMTPLYEAGLTPKTILDWGPEVFLSKIRSIGLAPTKAKNVHRLSEMILNFHNGEVPRSREDLEALPGVGRKTASVVLSELFGEPLLAVDTHVMRVSERLGWHREKTPLGVEKALLPLLPKGSLPRAHHWLILHGRYTCKAQRPLCGECPIALLCPSQEL